MARSTHPKKDIEAAVKYAESKKWRYKPPGNSAHVGPTAQAVQKFRTANLLIRF